MVTVTDPEPAEGMSDEELSELLDDMLDATNERRTALGLPPLVWAEDGPDGDTG